MNEQVRNHVVCGSAATMMASIVARPLHLEHNKNASVMTLEEAAIGLYRGAFMAMLRNSLFSSGRLGAYFSMKKLLKKDSTKQRIGIHERVALAGLTTFTMGILSYPIENYASTKFVADSKMPESQMRSRLRLWRGSSVYVLRMMVIGTVKLTTYDTLRPVSGRLLRGGGLDGEAGHVVGAMVAAAGGGLLAAAAITPVDAARAACCPALHARTPHLLPLLASTAASLVHARGLPALWNHAIFARQCLTLIPYSVVLFTTYEVLMRNVNHIKARFT